MLTGRRYPAHPREIPVILLKIAPEILSASASLIGLMGQAIKCSLGDQIWAIFFDALVRDPNFGYDVRNRAAECMDIKFTKYECRHLGVRPRISRWEK